MNFSVFAKLLYPFCGNGETPSNFLLALLDAFTTDNEDPFFDKSSDELKRIYEGKRKSLKSASYFLSKHSKEDFDSYIYNLVSDDALVELCGKFEPYVGNTTAEDVSIKLTSLLVAILYDTINGTTTAGLLPSSEVNSFGNYEMEKDLAVIIRKLASLTPPDVKVLLSYEPYNVDIKIPTDGVLNGEVKNAVALYYRYIEGLLQDASKTNTLFFKILAERIQYASDQFISEGLSQQIVFNNLTEWIKNRATTANETACRILVSFFVQNCEVFTIYETTK